MQLTADDEVWEQANLMVTVCNGPREGGGFQIAPKARNDDGILNYTLVSKCSRPMMFRLIPEFMNGTHERFDLVKMGTCQKFSLDSEFPVYIHADGEIYTSFGSNLHKVDFEILPGALKVVKG
jgi:diacylglycerol kinase (ATP)